MACQIVLNKHTKKLLHWKCFMFTVNNVTNYKLASVKTWPEY